MTIEDCKKKKNNLSMSWIDYRKAYDSVPHSWILKTLQMYRFNEKLIKFMEKCAKASFKKGKLALTRNIIIDEYTAIEELNQEGIYKYLGVDESDGIQHSK